MKAEHLPIPGIVLGAYPERRVRGAGLPGRSRAKGGRYRAFLARIAAMEGQFGDLEPAVLARCLSHTRAGMAKHGMTDELVAEAFALIKRACARELRLELFGTQLLAARAMLDRQLAEMATGEGKTLAAGVCAATAALAGIPVHVITANEYLVTRDAKLLEPVYRALGLSVAAVIQPLDAQARRRAYDCDIVYCTASELVFDYLRDGLTRDRSRSNLQQRVAAPCESHAPPRETLLRGLCMAIVDEADSILIDEARVPLILSERRSNEGEKQDFAAALELAELKGACETGTDTGPVAQITYQRFFQRYLALAGMSGTLAEARAELRSTYGLRIVKVPLRQGDRRTVLPTRLYPDHESQWQAVVAEAMEMKRHGRPVLIGTDSVADSEGLSRRFAEAGVPHAVLNARQDSEEARVIARAGQAGQITIATNMAGRGTDIALGRGVAALGGLHVICCQHSTSRRIERQLLGRCARQGDPGSAQTLLALDKPLIAPFVPQWFRRRVSTRGMATPSRLVQLLVRAPQHLAELRQRAQRRNLLRQELRAAKNLSFGRPME